MFLPKDISQSLNFDVIGDRFVAEYADSVGQTYYKRIKPDQIKDFDGKKPVMNYCLIYYEGKELHSITKSEYKKYLAHKRYAY